MLLCLRSSARRLSTGFLLKGPESRVVETWRQTWLRFLLAEEDLVKVVEYDKRGPAAGKSH